MIVSATHHNARISPQKVRLYRQLLRRLPVSAAEHHLAFLPGKGPKLVAAVLKSAIANAIHNFGAAKENLTVHEVVVNAGFSLKRFKAASRGIAHGRIKRMSHITVAVHQPDTNQAKPKKKDATAGIKKNRKISSQARAGETAPIKAIDNKKGASEQARRSRQDQAVKMRGKIITQQQGSESYKTHRRKTV